MRSYERNMRGRGTATIVVHSATTQQQSGTEQRLQPSLLRLWQDDVREDGWCSCCSTDRIDGRMDGRVMMMM